MSKSFYYHTYFTICTCIRNVPIQKNKADTGIDTLDTLLTLPCLLQFTTSIKPELKSCLLLHCFVLIVSKFRPAHESSFYTCGLAFGLTFGLHLQLSLWTYLWLTLATQPLDLHFAYTYLGFGL